jgi:hypothetical protein
MSSSETGMLKSMNPTIPRNSESANEGERVIPTHVSTASEGSLLDR